MNGYTTQDVKELLEAIKSPEDNSTFILSGEDYNAYMNRQTQSLAQTKQEGKHGLLRQKTFPRKIGFKFTEYIQRHQKSRR